MIEVFDEMGAEALFGLYGRGLTLQDQWSGTVAAVVDRTGVAPAIVETAMRAQGFGPTDLALAADELCDALAQGTVVLLDGTEAPQNHAPMIEPILDLAARCRARAERHLAADTPRALAVAEIAAVHGVSAYVAGRVLAKLGRVGAAGGRAAINAASLILITPRETVH